MAITASKQRWGSEARSYRAASSPSSASANASGSNGARSSEPSPSPTNLTGMPISRWTAMTMPPFAPFPYRVECDGGRVTARRTADRLGTHSRSPGGQLVDGGRTEGVRGPEYDGAAVRHQHPGQLAAGRGLARAVDPHHQHNRRPVGVRQRVHRPVVVP